MRISRRSTSRWSSSSTIAAGTPRGERAAHHRRLLRALQLLEQREQAVEAQAAGGSEGIVGFARLHGSIMPLADTFQEIVDSLPSDWTDLEFDLRVQEDRYIDAAQLLVQVNAQPYSNHDWHWRIIVAHQFGHAAAAPPTHGTLKLLDDAGHRRRAGAARAAHRPRRDDADVGPPGVRAAGVPPPAVAVVAAVVALFDDLLLGSNVLGMLRAAGHEARLAGSAEQARPDGAAVLIVDLGSAGFDGVAVVEGLRAAGELGETRTLGVYSHVDVDTKRRADAAGFDLVVPRSRMAREGPALVERLVAA